jgi:hypothetical protein
MRLRQLVKNYHGATNPLTELSMGSRQKELKIINRTIAVIIIVTNIYFIPLNYVTIKEAGEPLGYGLLMLPVLLSSNIFLITAGLTFKTRFQNNILLLSIKRTWAHLELILVMAIINNTEN